MFLFKGVILEWGKEHQKQEEVRIDQLQRAFRNIKFMHVMGGHETAISNYHNATSVTAEMTRKVSFLQSLPRTWIEFVAIAGLLSIVIIRVLNGDDILQVVPMLGAFLAAAVRLLPAGYRLLTGLQQLRYVKPTVDLIHEEFFQARSLIYHNEKDRYTNRFKSLVLSGVNFKYPGNNANSLNNVSVSIDFGDSIGIIGESGAGKSTLVDLFLGLLEPISGEIKLNGKRPKNLLAQMQQFVGYVPQNIYIPDDTLASNVACASSNDQVDTKRVFSAIEQSGLSSLLSQLPEGINSKVGENGSRLSGGQKQRLAFARALYKNHQILVLDEPTSALDIHSSNEFFKHIFSKQIDATLIIITHKREVVTNCDVVLEVKDGEVFELVKQKNVQA